MAVFKIKVLRNIFRVKHWCSHKWIEEITQRRTLSPFSTATYIVKEMKKWKLMWARHAWKNNDFDKKSI